MVTIKLYLMQKLRSDQTRYWFIKSWQAQLNNA